jgi:hypothetical protein
MLYGRCSCGQRSKANQIIRKRLRRAVITIGLPICNVLGRATIDDPRRQEVQAHIMKVQDTRDLDVLHERHLPVEAASRTTTYDMRNSNFRAVFSDEKIKQPVTS